MSNFLLVRRSKTVNIYYYKNLYFHIKHIILFFITILSLIYNVIDIDLWLFFINVFNQLFIEEMI